MPLLTDHLVSLKTPVPYESATGHPFLIAAGNGSLDSGLLSLWLSQDRIYAAHAYPKFIGSLIANIPFDSSHGLDSPQEKFNQRTLKLLLFCLENVVREAGFFKETAQKWNLNLEGWPERKGTRDYTAEMARISNTGNLADGLVFLWAMEKVYLDAWSSVQKQSNALPSTSDPTRGAILSLAKNWSSPEFITFVNDLAGLVDSLDIQPESTGWKRAEKIWERVVELEAAFWPLEYEG
ncbi:hypothetical protein GYMLUDRAFT_237699 [Collybiopsis luxurians FD-317 M1]|nr:hypothetical protein GYMLUDRAFT_237699 [Collybiopsis luxurians FD-317 M1]